MPLRLNVGLSQKIGQPDYGSLGASCHVEVELDGGLLQHDLEAFQRHVRTAFVACRQAVRDELANAQSVNSAATLPKVANGSRTQSPPPGKTNGTSQRGERTATVSQVRALHKIAERQKLNLPLLLGDRFQLSEPSQLSIGAASRLIDELNGNTGVGERRAA